MRLSSARLCPCTASTAHRPRKLWLITSVYSPAASSSSLHECISQLSSAALKHFAAQGLKGCRQLLWLQQVQTVWPGPLRHDYHCYTSAKQHTTLTPQAETPKVTLQRVMEVSESRQALVASVTWSVPQNLQPSTLCRPLMAKGRGIP